MSDFDVNGLRIVVTGAASGIGAAVANLLTARGAEVIGLDLQQIDTNVAEKIKLDLSDSDSIKAASAQIDGPVDALCNIAGVSMSAPREVVLAVNWLGTKLWTDAVLPKIKRQGVVINTASIGGRAWRQNLDQVKACLKLEKFEHIQDFCEQHEIVQQLSYKLTKEVTVAWTMTSARDWGSREVRCNAVSPGIVDTPMLAEALASSGERGQKFLQTAPRFCSWMKWRIFSPFFVVLPLPR